MLATLSRSRWIWLAVPALALALAVAFAVTLTLIAACSHGVVPAELCEVPEPTPSARTPQSRLADRLLRRWAPTYVQRVDPEDGGADRPTRVDFDGDWDSTNNWDNQARHGTALPPAAYGAAILTDTHAYLTYTLYYPRDWNRGLCLPLVCHDNDLETVLVVIERDAGDGRLVEVRTKAHWSMADTAAAAIMRAPDGRPVLNVEPEGHGIAVCKLDDPRCEARPGRIVYAPGATASSPPRAAEGQTVTYELLSLRDSLWARRGLAHCRLWTPGETGPLHYMGKRLGRIGGMMGASMAGSRYAGGVRPPWALKGASGTRGDWFLDPASDQERYVFNPFLDDLRAECTGPRCGAAPEEPSKVRRWASLAASGLALSLGLVTIRARPRSLARDARSDSRTSTR